VQGVKIKPIERSVNIAIKRKNRAEDNGGPFNRWVEENRSEKSFVRIKGGRLIGKMVGGEDKDRKGKKGGKSCIRGAEWEKRQKKPNELKK